jgi:hypothetical protein
MSTFILDTANLKGALKFLTYKENLKRYAYCDLWKNPHTFNIFESKEKNNNDNLLILLRMLHDINIIAYNNRYNAEELNQKIDFKSNINHNVNAYQALKTFKCLRYNSICKLDIERIFTGNQTEFKQTYLEVLERLNQIIIALSDLIINDLDAYNNAEWG